MSWNAEDILQSIRNASQNSDAFSLQAVQQLMEISRIQLLLSNSIIVTKDQRIQNISVPLDEVIHGYDTDNENIVHKYEIGSFIGLNHALSTSHSPFDIIVNNPAHVLSIPYTHLRSLIEHDSHIRWQIIEFISNQALKPALMQPEHIAQKGSKRMAQFIVNFTNGTELEDSASQIEFRISQEELGARIGVSRQSANKYIQEFVELGWLSKRGHRYYINNLEALIKFQNS